MIRLVADNLPAIRALAERYGVARLELFGSAATEAFDPDSSDLDLIATFTDTTPEHGYADRFLAFAEELERLFGRRIDLLTPRASQNPYVVESIDASRTVLYASATGEAVAIEAQNNRLSVHRTPRSMQLRSLGYLWSIVGSARFVLEDAGTITLPDYAAARMLRFAVERQLGILGQAAHGLLDHDPETASRLVGLHDLVELGDELARDYDRLDNSRILRIIRETLPPLLAEAEAVIQLLDPQPGASA